MNIEQKTGYDRIREQVAGGCVTNGGRHKFEREGFLDDRQEIVLRLRLVDQMMRAEGFPACEYYDIGHLAARAGVEGTFLAGEEVAVLGRALRTAGEVLAFLRGCDVGIFAELCALGERVEGHAEILREAERIVDEQGVVRDGASPELADIRRSIREREGRAAKRLQAVLAAAKASGVVEAEAMLSVRDGRAVIPVAAANKRKLPGFILGESASGRTAFIEPVEVVEINNELRELEYAGRREEVRILTFFTDSIRPYCADLHRVGELLVTLDMLRAKARWATANRCVMPIVSYDGTLELRQARHPLLEQNLRREGREVVPLDLILSQKDHILVISGPNAGGKSVCLKTVGLLQWMFQCGMPIPALENSQMPVFDKIFIDIGDQQSIDNDLSTYSSHLLNMKRVLSEATRRSLVLIDEFGTGTEPVMGGAIAEAILQKLADRGCYGVVTTHYSNLKYFASNAAGVVNGAMMFDVANIGPLFRLEIGMPGSSFAVEIARKIGLPEDIIRAAADKAGSDHVNIERQLREIARDRRYWEQKRDRIRIADRRIEELEAKYEASLSAIKQQRAEILKRARDEAGRIAADANRLVESTIRTIRESQADKELTRLARRELDDFRANISEESPDTADVDREMERILARRQRRSERAPKPAAPAAVEAPPPMPVVGAKVRIEGQDTVGEVQSIRSSKATVAFGHMVTTVPLDRLTVVSNAEYKRQARTPSMKIGADISARKLNFQPSIDIRGERVADALEQVRDFVDNALMLGVGEVTILHGKGTGALKEEIRRYLRTVPAVASATDEHADRGGSGITVVKFE